MATAASAEETSLPLEASLLQLSSAFIAAGFEVGIPDGLLHLLRTYGAPSGGEVGRKALYKRLYGILWFGSKKTLGAREEGHYPTYIYPSALKAVVRARFPDVVRDWVDPDTPTTYKVTYADLAKAKWPAHKKK